MKNTALKYYTAIFYLCSTFVMFAQPGGNDAGGGLENDGDTTPAAPIDDYVMVLALIGLVLVFIKVRASYKQNTQFNQ